MAEIAVQVIVSPFLEVIFGNLNSLIQKEFGLLLGVNRDLEKLSSTLSTIQCVLKDAEDMQIREAAARDWLRKIKDAAFDAENIFDECQVEALRFESDIDRKACSEQVSHSLSTCFDFRALLFRRRMGKQIKLLSEKFEEIANERKFHLNPAIVESGVEQLGLNRETSSTLTQPIIYGRDEERDLVVQMLLNNVSSENNLSISPILGIGGLGKTILAQLVYNDKRVSDQFDAKIWICVSDDFGIKRIVKMVLDHLSENASALVDLDAIQNQTRRLLHGKKFLLVLDDVWDDSQENWNQMIMFLLSCGNKGSSVMVTTRLQTVIVSMTRIETSMALIIHPTLHLQTLSKRDCWSLFKHYAFRVGGEENQNLAELGQEIVGKCGGLPLAVKALGGLLHLQNEKFWRIVNDNEIWNLQKHGEHGILPVLRLSYNHLPQVLRQCFAFCAVYPKNYKFEKDKLVNQWIANGFIQSKDNMEVEDIGDMVFNELLRRSFFLNMNELSKHDEIYCKIHDLMHDLACSVMVEECLNVKIADTKDVPRRIRHMYVIYESQVSQSTLQKLSRSQPFFHTLIFGCTSSGNTLDYLYSSFSKLKFLKVLTLSPLCNFKILPLWIGHLKHLRYLDLSLTDITSLPESICSLENLQILNISCNFRFKVLTPSIGKLVNLRCLDLSHTVIKKLPETICNLTNLQYLNLLFCSELKHLPNKIGNMKSLRYLQKRNQYESVAPLIEMPVGIGELTCLETILPIRLVRGGDNRSECAGIQELERLNRLKGKLEIHDLQNVDDPRDAERANLKIKTNLSQLYLQWTWDDYSVSSSEERSEFNVLRALQPHRYLQELSVWGYKGKLLPSWMGDFAASLPKLTTLDLMFMRNVEGWLPSASTESGEEDVAPQNNLILPPSLKKLSIIECPNIKIQALPSSIEELEVGRSNDPTLSWVNDLPHLSSLAIYDFDDGLPEAALQNFAHLDSLYFFKCSELKLSEMFQTLAGNLRKLRFEYCIIEDEDEGLEYQLGSLQKLTILNCESLKSLYWWQHLKALQTLKLGECPDLDISAVGFQHLRNLRFLRLFNLPQLSSLPDGIQHLTRLEILYIVDCKNLKMLPEWIQRDHLLPALQHIHMIRCHPELHKRCTRDKGEDWHKISHVYVLNIPD